MCKKPECSSMRSLVPKEATWKDDVILSRLIRQGKEKSELQAKVKTYQLITAKPGYPEIQGL